MSILIHGMEMPSVAGCVPVSLILWSDGVAVDPAGKKYRWEQLPPHGRLGDVDALSKSLDRLCDRVCQYSKTQRKVMCGSCPLGHAFAVVEDDAPTIIPAEGGEQR